MAKAKKLPSGSWRVQVFVGLDENGKQIRKSFTAPTKKEAEFMAAEFKARHKEIAKDSSAMTLTEGIDSYIKFKGGTLSPSTVAGYRSIQRNAFPSIMNVKMNKLSVSSIQAAINAEVNIKSSTTIQNETVLVKSVLKMYAPHLSLTALTLPQKEKFESQKLTLSETITLFKLIVQEPDEYAIPLLLAMCGGLRASEIIGLTWGNYEPDTRRIYVKSAIVVDEHGNKVRKQTKTTESKRDFTIPKTLAKKLVVGDKSEPIVTVTMKVTRNKLHALCRKNNIPDIRLHDLRHLNASIMLYLGIPSKYAMERGGWDDIETMDKIYQFTFEDEKKMIDDKINNFFDSLTTDG